MANSAAAAASRLPLQSGFNSMYPSIPQPIGTMADTYSMSGSLSSMARLLPAAARRRLRLPVHVPHDPLSSLSSSYQRSSSQLASCGNAASQAAVSSFNAASHAAAASYAAATSSAGGTGTDHPSIKKRKEKKVEAVISQLDASERSETQVYPLQSSRQDRKREPARFFFILTLRCITPLIMADDYGH
nr:uncharacterized protein LOC113811561 [Penaeus vannamei]